MHKELSDLALPHIEVEEIPAEVPANAENVAAYTQTDSILHQHNRTDTANGRRLVTRHGRDLRYIPAWNSWLVWDSSRWLQDATCAIDARMKDVAKSLWGEVRHICKTLDPVKDKGEIREMRNFASYSNSARGVAASISMAKSEPGVAITHHDLDKNDMLLNVLNGVIDLRTGAIRHHHRDDLITMQAPVLFDIDAECPTWLRFLKDVFEGDQALINYIQRLIGYCLTGNTREHVLPFLYGAGANGKSVFTIVIMQLLGGDYSMRAAPELLMARGGETHPTERADLFSKRLVISNEIEAGKRLNESLVKDLTGGDNIRARRMREDFWEFRPTHKVWLVGNHKPVIRGTDNGIWRRVKLIPFTRVFAENEQDKELPAKLLRELSGILNWAISGCLQWQVVGLGEPEAVRQATAEYRSEQDAVSSFIDEKCIISLSAAEGRVKSACLYARYKEWSEANGERPMGKKTFGEEIGKRFERITSNGTWYLGIELKSE